MDPFENFKRMKPGFDFAQAVAEADRCLLCHDAPCSHGCPARTDPGTFIRKLRFKNIAGAARTVKTNNILGGACGVLCPTARLCEKACSARMQSEARPGGTARPIQIGAIQRFLVEYAWQCGLQLVDAAPARPERIAVVGSGPGGLSCAAELGKAGFQATVFEARPEPGGVLRYGVVAYRFDTDFLTRELGDIRRLGVRFVCNHPVEGPAAAEMLLEEGFSAVFLAPGLWEALALQPDDSRPAGLLSSVDYLCALRDGRFETMRDRIQGKTVAVIGGGSVAMDCVESAVRLGAADVYLVYRRSYAQMPAEADERIEALEAGVHYLLLNQPVGYVTGPGGAIAGIRLVRTRLEPPAGSGRRRPKAVEGSEWVLDADLVVEAIGNRPSPAVAGAVPNIRRNDGGLIVVDPQTGRTSVDGIFAGGDIVRGPSLVVYAVQDGKVAARAIEAHLDR